MARKSFINRSLFSLSAKYGHIYLYSLFGTCRFHEYGWEKVQKSIQAGNVGFIMFWHCILALPLFYLRQLGAIPLVGLHRDADMLAQIGMKMGYRKLLRGSSNRRSIKVIRELSNVLQRSSSTIMMTPDGPRGPARVPKYGSIEIARHHGALIYPLGAAASRYKTLDTWDKFRVIKPFSRVVLVWGDPLMLEKNVPVAALSDLVAAKINEVQEQADMLAEM